MTQAAAVRFLTLCHSGNSTLEFILLYGLDRTPAFAVYFQMASQMFLYHVVINLFFSIDFEMPDIKEYVKSISGLYCV